MLVDGAEGGRKFSTRRRQGRALPPDPQGIPGPPGPARHQKAAPGPARPLRRLLQRGPPPPVPSAPPPRQDQNPYRARTPPAWRKPPGSVPPPGFGLLGVLRSVSLPHVADR